MTENNKEMLNFKKIIQHAYSSEFSIGWNTFKTPLLIFSVA